MDFGVFGGQALEVLAAGFAGDEKTAAQLAVDLDDDFDLIVPR